MRLWSSDCWAESKEERSVASKGKEEKEDGDTGGTMEEETG